MFLVTGGAGFVGSHIVRALNARGDTDIVVVDDLRRGEKFENLRDCVIADYMDKAALGALLEEGGLPGGLRAILHQGACTNTMEGDGRYLMENNFTFSKLLLEAALAHGVPLVYASSAAVYGNVGPCREAPENERPLNAYGYSKLVFDQYVRRVLATRRVATTLVGLRYFNVYGPRETHKGAMASMVYHVYRQVTERGCARLFEGTDGFSDGEQRRDFVYVDDVVDANLFFAEGPPRQGIVNVGAGVSHTFNDLARLVIARCGRGHIDYIPFDPALVGRYQSHTEADLTALRAAGYTRPMTPLEAGVRRCLEAWGADDAAASAAPPAAPSAAAQASP